MSEGAVRTFSFERATKNKVLYSEEEGEDEQMSGAFYISKKVLEEMGFEEPPAKLRITVEAVVTKKKTKKVK